jgi:uncharacterized membrane protein
MIFAALYAVSVVALAPISFQVFQVRIGDALLPLSILFGWPAIIGLSVGALVANFFGGLGFVDIIGGALANFVATYLAFKIGQKKIRGKWFFAISAEVLSVTVIVGSYLSYLFQIPFEMSLFGVFVGTLISTGLLGSVVLIAVHKTNIHRLVGSHEIAVNPEADEGLKSS